MQYQGGTRNPLLGSPLKRPAPLTSPHAPALSPLTKRPRPPVPYTTPDAARPVNPAELTPLGTVTPSTPRFLYQSEFSAQRINFAPKIFPKTKDGWSDLWLRPAV